MGRGRGLTKILISLYSGLPRIATLDIVTGHPARPESCLGQEWDAIWDLVLLCMSKERTNRPTALELVESQSRLNALPGIVSSLLSPLIYPSFCVQATLL